MGAPLKGTAVCCILGGVCRAPSSTALASRASNMAANFSAVARKGDHMDGQDGQTYTQMSALW